MTIPEGDHAAPDRLLRKLFIGLHDLQWSSDTARDKGLARLASIHAAGASFDERDVERRLVRLAIVKLVPIALRSAAQLSHDPERAEEMDYYAGICERHGSRAAALSAGFAAGSAARAANATGASVALFAASCAYAACDRAANMAAHRSDQPYASTAALFCATADAASAYVDRDALLAGLADDVAGVVASADIRHHSPSSAALS